MEKVSHLPGACFLEAQIYKCREPFLLLPSPLSINRCVSFIQRLHISAVYSYWKEPAKAIAHVRQAFDKHGIFLYDDYGFPGWEVDHAAAAKALDINKAAWYRSHASRSKVAGGSLRYGVLVLSLMQQKEKHSDPTRRIYPSINTVRYVQIRL